jgi:uncharacterized protein YvpB
MIFIVVSTNYQFERSDCICGSDVHASALAVRYNPQTEMRSSLLCVLALIVLVAGAITVVAAPEYHVASPALSPSALFVIEQPTPVPTPAPTAEPTPTPALVATPNGQVTFAMPVYRQVMNLDCETAALQMGLAAMGHTYSQDELFKAGPYDPRLPVMGPVVGGHKTVAQWGDPYTSFVGRVDGADLIPTGYGVYFPVIASVARSHGAPNAYGREGFTPSEIYAVVAAGHPVVVWTETGWGHPYVGYWTTFDGQKKIRYSLIEHAVTLSGVSATQVRVNDPWKSGSQYWLSKREFESSWADFNNMAVVLQ